MHADFHAWPRRQFRVLGTNMQVCQAFHGYQSGYSSVGDMLTNGQNIPCAQASSTSLHTVMRHQKPLMEGLHQPCMHQKAIFT